MTAFLKMHGLGNDFVVFDARNRPLTLSAAGARSIADRKLGVGCDQVIVIEKSANGADAAMRIMNADGGEVESCGNAARCVARLLLDENGCQSVSLETQGGLLVCRGKNGFVTVDMGAPRFGWQDIPLAEMRNTGCFALEIPETTFAPLKEAAAVNVGNPHCVLFVTDAERAPVGTIGPKVERHPLFPARTNVEFVQVLSPQKLRMRVWERGTGITRACGTGACAAMAAARRRGLCMESAEVLLDGGPLTIDWAGEDSPIFMSGPTALAYRGEIDLESFG
jgi:diaminopimelate epimerase